MALCALAAVALRCFVPRVRSWSRNDESTMHGLVMAALNGGSYLGRCRAWLASPQLWCTPGPVRYGHIYPLAALYRLTGRRELGTVASWVSTAAGLLQVLLVGAIGAELRGPEVGLIAAGLAAVSPLGLAMGRRALQDAPVSATALAATWALLAGHNATGAVLLGSLLAQKEAALLLYPAVAAVPWLAGRGFSPWVFVVAIGLYVAGFAVMARGRVHLLWSFARAVSSVGDHPYAARHHKGPPHGLLVDLFVLAPVTCLLAVRSSAWAATLGAALVLLALVLGGATKNARLALPADGLIRVAAASALAGMHGWLAAGLFVLACAVELRIFVAVFIKGAVYDPVSWNLLAALKIIVPPEPGEAVAAERRQLFRRVA